MPNILLTGMSGVGKSSVIARLDALGHRAVDLDSPRWSELTPDESGFADPKSNSPQDWRWRTDEVRALLSEPGDDLLFVAGTSTQQGLIYPLLDHVVLLTVPERTARERLSSRTTNSYGKNPHELRRELELRAVVEPLLRQSACLEIDTSQRPLSAVVESVIAHLGGGGHPPSESGEV